MVLTKTKHCSMWEDSQITSLRRDKLNLTNELTKLEKMNDLLREEKKELEIRLKKERKQTDNQDIRDIEMDIHMSRLGKWFNQPHLPEDIEKSILKVDVTIRKELFLKIEDLLSLLTCVVCSTNVKTVAYASCRHLVACNVCSKNLDNSCLLCRKKSEKVTIFL